MTTTAPALPALDAAIDEAQYVWRTHCIDRGILNADVSPWEPTSAPDGTPMLTGQATGRDALLLVQSMTALGRFALDKPGDQPPLLDVSAPGRVACVWRTGGVWVSLWAAEPIRPAVRPSPAPRRASAPAGRLLRWLDSSKPTPAA